MRLFRSFRFYKALKICSGFFDTENTFTKILGSLLFFYKKSMGFIGTIDGITLKINHEKAINYKNLNREFLSITYFPFNKILQIDEPLIINDYKQKEGEIENIFDYLCAKSFIGAPIVTGDYRILGIIGLLDRKKAYMKTSDMDYLELASTWLANLIYNQELKEKNKILNESIAKISMIDDLTGVYKESTLLPKLDYEFVRSKRYTRPLACLLIEIDQFDNIYKTYGENIACFMLKEISLILRGNLRTVDSIFRYRDTNFFMILPETRLESAFIIAERIRYQIENYEFAIINERLKESGLIGSEDKLIPIKLNIGISATSNSKINSAIDFISASDVSLSQNKQEKRYVT